MRLTVREFGAHIKKSWLLLLLALPFTVLGLGLFSSAVSTVWEGHQMQSWQPVKAHLEHAELHSRQGDNSTIYSVRAVYHYDYEGQTFRSDRVLPGSIRSGDAVERQLANYLESALAEGRPVVAWINPEKPAQAILYRKQRWASFISSASFGLIFGGVGLVLLWLCLAPFRSSSTRPARGTNTAIRPAKNSTEPTTPEQAWQRYRPWATSSIQSTAKTVVGFVRVFTILWNLFAFPMALIALTEMKEKPEAIIALLFPMIGVGLMVLTYTMARRWRHFGHTPLQMDPYPGAIGGQVGGVINVPLPYDPGLQFKTSLSCVHSYLRGSGENQERREEIVWQSDGFAHTHDHEGTTRLEILFDVEKGLPASDVPGTDNYHLWSLRVQAHSPHIKFDRSFEIPVFPTGASASQQHKLSTEHPHATIHRLETIESVMELQQIPGGVEIFYPAFRKPLFKVIGIMISAISLIVGIGSGLGGAPLVASWGLSLLGACLLAFSVYCLAVSLNVRLDGAGLQTERHLWGRRVDGKQIKREDLRGLRMEHSGTVQTGQTYTVYFRLLAVTHANKTIKIGHNLAGRDAAAQALEAVSLLTGIPVETEEDKGGALA